VRATLCQLRPATTDARQNRERYWAAHDRQRDGKPEPTCGRDERRKRFVRDWRRDNAPPLEKGFEYLRANLLPVRLASGPRQYLGRERAKLCEGDKMKSKLTRRIAQKIMIQKRRSLEGQGKRLEWERRRKAELAAVDAERERRKRAAWQARKDGGGW
jgi:hypothetical protein